MSQGSGKPVRVAAFTGSRTISSRRFRVKQYISPLVNDGIQLTEFVAPFGSWPPPQRVWRPAWFVASILSRLPSVTSSHGFDLTLLQREMISTLVTLEGLTRRPRVLDVDDAIWLNPRADKNFPKLARMCDGVICGNSFIAENVGQWNSNVTVIPTAVDTDRFRPDSAAGPPMPIIGWSGLNAGFKYLLGIESALVEVLKRRPEAVLRIVSDVKPRFRQLDESRMEYIPWSPEAEVRTIQEMSLGLMPIDDSLWSRGKCSCKMLLYMACGVPVVVSPYGMNREILSLGNAGLQARDDSEWMNAITWILDHPKEGHEMGTTGRRIVEEQYSVRVSAPKMASFLKRFVGR